MESIIAMWVGRFERGAVSRRELIQSLTVLATAAAGTTASAAGFEVSAIDHIQINASNAKRSSEWYQKVLGLKPVRAGEMGDETEEIAHVGTPGNLLLSLRKLQPAGQIDHIGFRVIGATQQDIVRDLKARGEVMHPADPTKAPGSYLHDPDGVRIQIGGKVTVKPY